MTPPAIAVGLGLRRSGHAFAIAGSVAPFLAAPALGAAVARDRRA